MPLGRDGRPFTIVQLSDLHCGQQFFLPTLLERAIVEVNELAPDVVVISGDLTSHGFKEEYAVAKEYVDAIECASLVVIPGNHDSRNVGYVHFEELFGDRNSVLRVGDATIVAVDSTEPDLDNGQIGRGRYGWIEEQFADDADLRIFVLHHHLLPVPGTGRERNIVNDAGDALECLQRAGVDLVLSGHKHVPYAWRLEDLFIVNAGTVSSSRLRGNGRPCYNVVEVDGTHVSVWRKYPFHDQERIIQFSTETKTYEKYTARIEGEVRESPVKAVAIIDGEHYPDVVREALAELPYDFIGVMLVGGSEKLRGAPDYGVPLVMEPGSAEIAVDLSDEPVLDPRTRLHLASRFLADGIPYVGADFRFDPPTFHPFEVPSLAVIGTGKRVGKTAVTGAVARALAGDRRVVVVAMGRGGPAAPELIESPPSLDDLVALSRSGRHAASDHLETAVLAGVPTIGCRRAGGGMAGAPFTSNVLEGAALAASLDPDVVVFDGSGAAIPPIDVDARILVAHDVVSGLNPYRVLISDVVLTMSEEVAHDVRALGKPAIRFGLRLRPAEQLTGTRIAVFATGKVSVDHLDDVVSVSRNLSDRVALEEDLRSVDADAFVVEIKAAAIDMVAEAAIERGIPLVFADNEVVPFPGEPSLDELFRGLAPSEVRA